MLNEILRLSNSHKDDYCKNITESSYIQKNLTKTEEFNDLTEMIISCNDPNYTLLQVSEREFYLKQRRLEIGSEIEENNSLLKSCNFNSFLSLKKIQSGLMKKNTISSVFFLSEYYKHRIILVDHRDKTYYETPKKFEKELIIRRDEEAWSICAMKNEYKLCPLKNIEGLEKDIVSYDVYDIPLKSESSYKLDKLQSLALEKGINTKRDNGKSKTKKVLYEELRTHFLNLI